MMGPPTCQSGGTSFGLHCHLVPYIFRHLYPKCYIQVLQTETSVSASTLLHVVKLANIPAKISRPSYCYSTAPLSRVYSHCPGKERFLFKPVHSPQSKRGFCPIIELSLPSPSSGYKNSWFSVWFDYSFNTAPLIYNVIQPEFIGQCFGSGLQ